MLFPDQVRLEADEVQRINRVRLALLLHKLPDEIDAAKARDIGDIIAVKLVDNEFERRQAKL